ncbi:MAG: NADH-ubiquinone oxidoreductase chain G, partial [uncultured Blastococcus sp.]
GAGCGRHTPARLLARGVGRRGRRSAAGPCRRRRRGAPRWPAHRRGRLRLREVRPGGAGHQRRRLPRPGALGRGARIPGGDRRRYRPRDRGGHLRRPVHGARRPPRRLRAGGGVPDRLPPAAPRGPDREDGGVRPGAVRHPRRAEAAGHRALDAAGCRGAVPPCAGGRHLGRPGAGGAAAARSGRPRRR